MCLIIHGPSALIRRTLLESPGLIDNIYRRNGDGLGVMYAGSDGPHVGKWLPRNADKARRLVAALPDDERPAAMHWRWRTHGHIDKANCHPCELEGSYVMHNGVLDTGNGADQSKSDTWHYCQWFLSGGVLAREAHEPAFQLLIEHHIGPGNKLVVLTADGRMSVIGRRRGIELAGLWWSNTYAWEPRLADPAWVDPDAWRYPRWNKSGDLWTPQYRAGLDQDDWSDDGFADARGIQDGEPDAPSTDEYLADLWLQLLVSADADGIADLLDDHPYTALPALFRQGWIARSCGNADPYGLMPLIVRGEGFALARECRSGRAGLVANALAYDTEWTFSDPEDATELQPASIDA